MRYIIAIGLFIFSFSVFAFDGLETYTTQITKKDRQNSKGKRLKTVKQIIRQDRANYCKHHHLTTSGRYDGEYFCDPKKRKLIDTAKIKISKKLKRAIAHPSHYHHKVKICVTYFHGNELHVDSGSCPRV